MRNAIRKAVVRRKGRVRMQAEELFRQVRTRQEQGLTMRQRCMDEFVVRKDGTETGISEPGEIGLVARFSLQNIRVLAQRELAPCEDAQDNATEE